jgi:hypothetical protein
VRGWGSGHWANPDSKPSAQHKFRRNTAPELNMIEILWKQAKYFWRKFETWAKDSFKEEIGEMLDGFGSKFQINFL